MTQALPTYERLHQIFDYKDGQLFRKLVHGKFANHGLTA